MKKYTASVKDKETGNKSLISSEYKTKKAFKEDLKANGYIVYAIVLDSEIKRIGE